MRIVAGRLRGRRLETPADRAVRPTLDRVRQALFDRLAHAAWAPPGWGATDFASVPVLDAFAGTGALACEALSRGAGWAVLLDRDPAAVALVRRNLATLGLGDRAQVLRADATTPPPPPQGFAAGLVFLDPPWGSDLAAAALRAFAGGGWLAPGALCVVEQDPARPEPLGDLPGWQGLDAARVGGTQLVFGRVVTH